MLQIDAERFRNDAAHDRDIVSLFKLLDIPFTGCGPTGLTLCKNKALSKQILAGTVHKDSVIFVDLNKENDFVFENLENAEILN